MIANRLRGLVNLHAAATVVLAGALLLAYQNVFHYLPVTDLSPTVSFLPYLLCVVVGMVVSTRYLQHMGARFHRLTWEDAAWLTTRQVIIVALFIFAFMFAFKDRGLSRLFVGTYLGLAWGMLLFMNLALPRFLSQLLFGRNRRVPALFIGSQKSLTKLRHWLASKEILGLQPVGFLSEDGQPGTESNLPFLGALADLPRIIKARQVVQVIALEIPRTQTESQFIIEVCQTNGCRLLIYSNLADQLHHPLMIVSEEGHQFYTLQEEPLEDPVSRVLKRAFDIAVSLPVVLFLLPPLMLLAWLMQRLQAPGRLFFRQDRTGHGQHPFRILKFRSMYDTSQASGLEARQARKGDNRIYPFGRFLRRTSLDEFPQFINVLKGEMSIVGPRPHMLVHDQQFSCMMKEYQTRFFAKPGITGLAQCHGLRGEITDPALLAKRIDLDLDYVSQWSIWLDLQITLKTAWQILFPPKSAY